MNKKTSDIPHFIAIGPQKTGTTWLYRTLKGHPELAMPPLKEINYFFFKERMEDDATLSRYFFTKHPLNKRMKGTRKRVTRKLLRKLKNGQWSWKEFFWYFRYFNFRLSDSWYVKLFEEGKKSGDISPNYSRLSEESIQKIAALNPDIKVIMGLRDPVERSWSAVKMVFVKERNMSTEEILDSSEVEKFLTTHDSFTVNDYVTVLEKWKRYVPENQIYIYFFDELREKPELLYHKICSFLAIDPVDSKRTSKKHNKGLEKSMPDELRGRIISANLPFIEKMQDYFDNPYPRIWLQKHQAFLQSHGK